MTVFQRFRKFSKELFADTATDKDKLRPAITDRAHHELCISLVPRVEVKSTIQNFDSADGNFANSRVLRHTCEVWAVRPVEQHVFRFVPSKNPFVRLPPFLYIERSICRLRSRQCRRCLKTQWAHELLSGMGAERTPKNLLKTHGQEKRAGGSFVLWAAL